MIVSGEKKEEYREIKPYWTSRLIDPADQAKVGASKTSFLPSSGYMRIVNGYGKKAPFAVFEVEYIRVKKAVPEWSDNWPGLVFAIGIGKRIV